VRTEILLISFINVVSKVSRLDIVLRAEMQLTSYQHKQGLKTKAQP